MNTLRAALSAFGILSLVVLAGADWPGFRGPHTDGVSDEHGLPIRWDDKENVVWKTRLPGPGASSPITWGDRVFVTCYSGYGGAIGKKGDMANLRRHLVCLDRKTGKVLWQKDVAAQLPETDFARQVNQHGYVTSTPVTDGERVYAFFGRTGVFAFAFDGKELWHADVGKLINTFGTGSSLALYKNLVLVNATVESGALIALDKTTGKEVWRVKGIGDCWTTPLVVAGPGSKHENVFN